MTSLKVALITRETKLPRLRCGFLVNWERFYRFLLEKLQFNGGFRRTRGKFPALGYVRVVWERAFLNTGACGQHRHSHHMPLVPIATCERVSSCEAFAANLFAPPAAFKLFPAALRRLCAAKHHCIESRTPLNSSDT